MYAIYAMLRLARTSSTSFLTVQSTKKSVWSSLVYSILSLYEGLGFNFSLLSAAKIQFLIGDIGYLFSSDVGYFYRARGSRQPQHCIKSHRSVWDMFFLYKYFFRWMVFVLAKSFNLDDRKSLSHNVVSSTPLLSRIRTDNISGDKHWLHK
jgi:hypothetical protein